MSPRKLYRECAQIVESVSFPTGTRGFPDGYPIDAPGFFPVTSGLFHSGDCETTIGRRRLLFVGQDWGCESNLADAKDDIRSPTAKHLGALLRASGIDLEECFFTNALWGVRIGKRNTGPSPAWNDPRFVDRCKQMLEHQIRVVRPNAVFCLGRHAPRLVAEIFPECAVWNTASSIAEIDEVGASVIQPRAGHPTAVRTVGLLVHPCYRKVNVTRRTHAGLKGDAAEIAILKECR